MTRSVRLSIWFGHERKLAVECVTDDASHFHIEAQAGGDRKLCILLPFDEPSGTQANVYQASDVTNGVNTIDNPNWDAIGIGHANGFVSHDLSSLKRSNHFSAGVLAESTPATGGPA